MRRDGTRGSPHPASPLPTPLHLTSPHLTNPPQPQTIPPPFLSPPTALLTDGSKGGWVDGLRGLKLCSPRFFGRGCGHSVLGLGVEGWEVEESVPPPPIKRLDPARHLWRKEQAGLMEWGCTRA